MLLRTIAFASVAFLYATSSNAATFYVAGNGTSTTCTAASPCSSLATALGLTSVGDTIVCVSPPVRVAFNITKSVTIDCSTARAPVRDNGFDDGAATVGVWINIPVSAADPLRTVKLRGLDIEGFTSGQAYFDRGIDIQAAGAVYIEDCVILNLKQQGILDRRTGGHTGLFIKDTVISGNGGAGIVAASAAASGTVLDNVTLENNAYGIAVAAGNNVVIKRSTFSGNSAVGIEGDAGSQIVVSNSTISHNSVGVQSTSSVRVSTNDIEFNNTAFSGAAATMGFNRFSGNGSMGTPLMPISGAPADIGP